MLTTLEFIRQLHKTPHKAVIAITGGGTEAIGELLRHGEGSNTLLEAVVTYANESTDRFLGKKPDKYVSAVAARDMAMAAFCRARSLSPDTPLDQLIGIGATSSLVKHTGEREGRRHFIYIGVQTHVGTHSYDIELKSHRSREDEESITADLILDRLGKHCGLAGVACGIHGFTFPYHGEDSEMTCYNEIVTTDDPIYRVVHKLHPMTSVVLNTWALERPKILMPGSFNPLHHRHLDMAQTAYEMLGYPVDFEISVVNPDKPSLHFHTIKERTDWFKAKGVDNPAVGQLYFTNTPTFVEKAVLFEDSPLTFVVGYDTLVRIYDPKYSGGSEVRMMDNIFDIKRRGHRFLVFHRVNQEISKEIRISAERFSTFVPEAMSKDDGISSTKLREAGQS